MLKVKKDIYGTGQHWIFCWEFLRAAHKCYRTAGIIKLALIVLLLFYSFTQSIFSNVYRILISAIFSLPVLSDISASETIHDFLEMPLFGRLLW